jgi:TRAP transporter TAXI family solute receptor
VPNDRNPAKHQIKFFAPAALLVIGAFVLAFQFVKPAPPRHLVMATGNVDGAYHAFATRYAEYFAGEGIELELRPSAGSIENLQLLRNGEVEIALVQGGVEPLDETTQAGDGLRSLGSVYYEPMWLFHRRDQPIRDLRDLAGRKIAAGPAGSGTRALVSELLRANGVADKVTVTDLGGQVAADALVAGEVDAAFMVISAQSPLVESLLRQPGIVLADFARADAYTRRYRFLNALELPEGALDLGDNIPGSRVRLLAPAANLVMHPELHPAVVDLMLLAASKVHGEGGWFEQRGQFPQPELLAYPLSDEAERFYEHGPPLLQRFLPFWAASLVDRLKVMLLPLLVLLFPLFKVMPPIYTWRMRARVYRWYDELEQAEEGLAAGRVDREWVFGELDRIEAEVRQVKVPLSFTDQLYHLRQHIELVRSQVAGT